MTVASSPASVTLDASAAAVVTRELPLDPLREQDLVAARPPPDAHQRPFALSSRNMGSEVRTAETPGSSGFSSRRAPRAKVW